MVHLLPVCTGCGRAACFAALSLREETGVPWGLPILKKHHVPHLERTRNCPIDQTFFPNLPPSSVDPYNLTRHLLANMKNVGAWSEEDVSRWLSEEGMQEYGDALRQTNGTRLLGLTKEDFQMPPLSLVSSDGGQQLLERVETLRIETHIEAHKNGHANGHAGGLPNGTSKPLRNGSLGMKDFRKEMVHIPIPTIEAARSSFPVEWGKTGVAFLYAVVGLVSTTVVISVVHERVPPKEHTPPLPDKFFDLFDRVEWAFSICEINGMLLVGLWLIQWILLKHRYT